MPDTVTVIGPAGPGPPRASAGEWAVAPPPGRAWLSLRADEATASTARGVKRSWLVYLFDVTFSSYPADTLICTRHRDRHRLSRMTLRVTASGPGSGNQQNILCEPPWPPGD